MEKHPYRSRLALAFACALAVLLAGCGVSATGDTGGASSVSHPATAIATPTATAGTPAHTATAPASNSASGMVTLAVVKAQFMPSEHILLTIHNGGSIPIMAEEHGTSCTMVLLEQLVNGVWQPVLPCVEGFPHPIVGQVPPETTIGVQLLPIATGDAEGTGGMQWPAGTYRAALDYVTNQTTSFSQGTIVYSATFAVG